MRLKKIISFVFILLMVVSLFSEVPTRILSMETGYVLPHRHTKIGIGDVAFGLYDYIQIGSNSMMDLILAPNIKVKMGYYFGDKFPMSIAAGALYWDFLGFSPIIAQSSSQLLTDELTGTLTGKLYGYSFYCAASYCIVPEIADVHINYKVDHVKTDVRGIGDFSIDPRKYIDNTQIYIVSAEVWGDAIAWHHTITAGNNLRAGIVNLYSEIGYDVEMKKMKWGVGIGLPAGGSGELLLGVVGPGVEFDDVNTGIIPVIAATWTFGTGEE